MLFGHQNDDTAQGAGTPPPPPAPTDDTAQTAVPAVNPLAVDTETGVGLPATDEDMTAPSVASPSAPEGSPSDAVVSAPEVVQEGPAIFETSPVVSEPEVTTSEPTTSSDAPADDANQSNLLTLKQQALAQLSPLVNQLDQSPEEKFRTTMMLLQSTDNSALIQDAYDAAQAIPDEKARAQALLDVVNEINYFTQQK